MDLFSLIVVIIAATLLARAINLGLKLGNRIAVASEATATIASAIYANMTPEAKAKGDQYLKDLKR